MKPRKSSLNPAQRQWVGEWWKALQPRDAGQEAQESIPGSLKGLKRSDRACLRRCAGVDELLAEPAALLLISQLIARNDERGVLPDSDLSYQRMAWVAGVLAQVKSDAKDGRSLAWHLGRAANPDRPVMGEIRFRRLQGSLDLPDLFRQWRRAVQLADGKADVAQLADDLLTWQLELHQAGLGAGAVKFRWAYDYYLTARERAVSDDSASSKELMA